MTDKYYLDNHIMLSLRGVGKKFCRDLKRSLLYGSLDTAKTLFGVKYDTASLRKHEFWALNDITIDLKKGEVIGVIGSNGSGKSTLLRLISGILSPDTGRIAVRGRVGTLIALGAGFHPYLSGRENIVLNGAILGMTRDEINDRTDEIIDFADIGEFIDAPVATYSSGMRVRLGFSIAVHSSPDILIIDEVLSVGDAHFLKKSYERLESLIRDQGVTAIVVSHNMGTIQRLCPRSIVLDKGAVAFIGDTDVAVLRYYESILGDGTGDGFEQGKKLVHHKECVMDLYADDFFVLGENGLPEELLLVGRPATFVVQVRNVLSKPVEMPMVNILVLNANLTELYVMFQLPLSLAEKRGKIDGRTKLACKVSYLGLGPGRYKVIIKIGSQDQGVFDSAIVCGDLKVDWPADLREHKFSLHSDFKCVMPAEWEFLD